MMHVHALRAQPPWPSGHGLPEEAQKELAPRRAVTYVCPRGHSFSLNFALDAEVPPAWDCRHCDKTARLEGAPEGTGDSARLPAYPQVGSGRYERDTGTSPQEQLAKRRSEKDGAAILAEALERVRQQRGAVR